MGKLSPARLNIGELVLQELCVGDGLSEAHRKVFGAALGVVQELQGATITAKPEDHQPVQYAPMVMGCSCGFRPQPARRMSQSATAFLSHIGKLGLPRQRIDPLIQYGEHKGQRFSQVYR